MKFWCGVASKEHVELGKQLGYCQVCHGKRSPLERMSIGDGLLYYSPVIQFKGREQCQKFTAIGKVAGVETYKFKMYEDFVPYRRDVEYYEAKEVAIRPLLQELEMTKGKSNWGYKFRFGHFQLVKEDFLIIANLMLDNRATELFLL
jgi:hypothetical protein